MNYLSNDLIVTCMLYLQVDDNNNEIEAFGNTCEAHRQLSIIICVDQYIDYITTDVSIPQHLVQYMRRYVTTEQQHKEIIDYMIPKMKKKIMIRNTRTPLPRFLRSYFSLIEPNEMSLLLSSAESIVFRNLSLSLSSSLQTISEEKLSMVVEYMETLTDCWVATNDTLLSFSTTNDLITNHQTKITSAATLKSSTKKNIMINLDLFRYQ